MPRVVRLGRAANDNARVPALRTRIVLLSLAVAAVAAVATWLF